MPTNPPATAAATSEKTAREYLRVSADPSGRLHSPAEQHADNQRAADSNGWTLGPPYRESGAVSASRYATKARAAFDALCRDLDAGQFAAQILILWENSRGSRRVGEWVALIEACEAAGVLVHVTTHGRTYDPGNARDRRSLLEDAVDSEYESAKISARTSRSKAARAAAGFPNGKVPYGYTRTYDPVTRKFASQDPHPDEAPVITELYARLRDGHSLRSIAKDFESRGVLTRGSKGYPPRPFSAQYLRDLALRPAYGGLRVHQPVSGGRSKTRADGAVPAVWPALVDAETWHSVHAMLTDPARRTTRPGRAVHLLSMIARCDVCGSVLAARRGGGKHHDQDRRDYMCRSRFCVRIDADDLDDLAEVRMLNYLARDDVIAGLRARAGDSPELAMVRGELAAVADELSALEREVEATGVSLALAAARERGLKARQKAAEKREEELLVPDDLLWLIEPGEDGRHPKIEELRKRWDDGPMSAKRRAARRLCSPEFLGMLLVARDPRRGRGRTPAADRVRWGLPA